MDLLKIANKLKESLLNYENIEYEDWITQKELMGLRHFLKKDSFQFQGRKSILDLLNNNHSLDSIHRSLESEMSRQRHLYDGIFDNIVDSKLDPLLIALENQNYEIAIREIEFVHDDLELKISKKIELLNKAYNELSFADLTTHSKSTIETIVKHILDYEGVSYDDRSKFPKIMGQFYNNFNITPKDHKNNKQLQTIASKLTILASTINDIRNTYSSSHGTGISDISSSDIPKHHSKLLLDATLTLSNFLISTYKYQKNKEV